MFLRNTHGYVAVMEYLAFGCTSVVKRAIYNRMLLVRTVREAFFEWHVYIFGDNEKVKEIKTMLGNVKISPRIVFRTFEKRTPGLSADFSFHLLLIHLFSCFWFLKVQEKRGASRESLQQDTTGEVCVGPRHGRKRLCFLISAFAWTQLASQSFNFSSHYACISRGIQFNLIL